MEAELEYAEDAILESRDRKNIFLLLSGRLIAGIGSGVFGFALSLYVLDITGSAGFFSLVLSFSIIPGILVNMFGGGLVDRIRKKKLIIGADLLSALLMVVFIIPFTADSRSLPNIVIFTILNSLVQSFYGLAITAAVPEMASEKNVARLNSVMQVISMLLTIVGPVLGAIFYKALGMHVILYLNAASYLFSSMTALPMYFHTSEGPAPGTRYLDDMREALVYLYDQKVLMFLMFVCVAINMIYMPMILLVMPYINYKVIGISGFQLSLVEAAFGIGGTFGGIYISTRKNPKKIIGMMFPLLFIQAFFLLLWIFPALPGLNLLGKSYVTTFFCLILGFTGLVSMIMNIPIYTHFQLEIPANLRGKVLGFINVSAMIALPLGMWAYGLLLESIRWHYLVCSAFGLLMVVCLLSRRNRHFANFAATIS